MQLVILPNQPTNLPPTAEVRDYDLGDGTFVRVIMELGQSASQDHYEMKAQAYQMDADGNFVSAPNGYPSRSHSSVHTISKSDLNRTLFMDDAWCEVPNVAFSPVAAPEDTTITEAPPVEPGVRYGQQHYDNHLSRLYMWKEGYADSTARAKVEDMRQVLAGSLQLSGLTFR